MMKIAHGGVTVGQVDHPFCQPHGFDRPRRIEAWRRSHRKAAQRSTPGRRSTRAGRRVRKPTPMLRGIGRERPAPAATRQSPSPATPCRRRAGEVAQFVKAGVGHGCRRPARRWRTASVRGAIRIAARSGSAAGKRSATSRACRQLARAAARSRWVSHVPARIYQPNAACRSPAALRCSAIKRRVFVGRFGALLDRGGQPPMQLRAVRLQLRFIGHGANQRMSERILDRRGEPDLVDQLTRDQLVEDWVDPQGGQQLGVEPRCRRPPRRSVCAWPPG